MLKRGETRNLPERPAGTKPHGLLKKLGVLAAALFLSLIIAEVILVVFFRDKFLVFEDETSLLYRYDQTLGWCPIPDTTDRFLASRIIHVINNSRGFRGPEPQINSKPGILFLGDSFVWGYDVDATDRFTEKLQSKHPEWNVYNLGVSGYGTDQEYLLLQQQFDFYKPRIVFLVFCTETDHFDNSWNARYGGYYKPYFTQDGNGLQLHGVPVPRSERVFLAAHPLVSRSCVAQLLARAWFKIACPPVMEHPDSTAALLEAMQMFITSRGSRLAVGLTEADLPVEQALRRLGIPFVELSTTLRYPEYGQHWTAAGHTYVADKIDEFLASETLLGAK